MLSLFMPTRGANIETGYGPSANFWYEPFPRKVASGVAVTDETAMTYSAVWAATRLLSATAGRLPLNLYRRSANRGKAVAKDDPRDKLLFRQPNPQMTPLLFKAQGVAQQVNAGNAFAEIQRDRTVPVALWPIHHSRVTIKLDPQTNDLYYSVKNTNAEPTDIPSADILHFPSMMSDDGICGKGVIAYARETIGLGLATERNGASVFGSGGMPRVVVESPKKWSQESRLNFRKEWKQIYSGPEGDKVGVMDEGSKLHTLNLSQEDMQFLETRQQNVEEIARWYGVPPHKIQQLLRATFSNIEHQSIEFITDSMMPWLVTWEEELDRKLLTEDEQGEMFFAFNVGEYLRGDTVARGQYWNMLVNSGIAARNEARIEEDLNPVPGGDTFLVQGAMVALDDTGKPQQSAQPASGFGADRRPPEETAEEPATSPASDTRSAVRKLCEATISRMVRIETAELKSSAHKPKVFCDSVDSFYDRFAPKLTDAIKPVAEVVISVGVPFAAAEFVADYVGESRLRLFRLADENTAATLLCGANELAEEWETSRAAAATRRIFEGVEA